MNTIRYFTTKNNDSLEFDDLTSSISLDDMNNPGIIHGYFKDIPYKFIHRHETIDMDSITSSWMSDEYKCRGLISSDDYVVDIGSYAGGFGIGVALETGCKSLMIEASESNYTICQANISLNEIGDRVFVKHLALSSEKKVGIIDQNIKHHQDLNASFNPHKYIVHTSDLECYKNFDRSNFLYDVDGININEIFSDIESCKFLKLDCEGGEISFLNDVTKDTLSKIEYISAEVHLGLTHEEFLEGVNSFDDITFIERLERNTHGIFLKKE